MSGRRFIFSLTLVLALALTAAVRPAQAADKPLLMEGKRTLYQRVITHPGAVLHESAGGQAGEPVTPFTVMYVYSRLKAGGQDWVQVASNTLGRDLAWLPTDTVSDWKQSLVLMFADRAGRSPLLFFNSPEELTAIAEKGGIDQALKTLGQDFQKYVQTKAEPPAGFPVLAMEPPDEAGAVPYDRFYLMPIFSWQEPFQDVKFLEVGSIDPGGIKKGGQPDEKAKKPEGALKNALVFVIDTTISMGPYIEKSLEVTRNIYDEIDKRGQGGNVALGVVAFRNSKEATPRIEYDSKVISPLRTAVQRADFEKALQQVKEARVSTHAFNEDSLAGLKMAIEELDWSSYDGRLILLITDAGPLEITDPYLTTMMTAREIADLAKAKNIRVITLHIKSPSGRKNHEYAERVYRSLSTLDGGAGLTYLPLEAPTIQEGVNNFATATEMLTSSLSQALFGSEAEPAGGEGLEGRAAELGGILGYSIKLDYLGRTNQVAAPQVVRSWISDRDLGRLAGADGGPKEVDTVQKAVLLTKDQLSTLSRQLRLIIDQAERSQLGSKDFFQSILSASSQLVQDPSEFQRNPNANLAQLGVLGEFLDGLPYTSEVMAMTEQKWYDLSVGAQEEFIHRLKGRVARYDEYDKDVDNWGKFGSPHPGDWLYRVPLNMLP